MSRKFGMKRILALISIAIAAALVLTVLGDKSVAEEVQVVVQWDDTVFSLSELHDIEDALDSSADGLYFVDGHDVGSGMANIFLIVEESGTKAAIERVIQVLRQRQWLEGARIAIATDYSPDRLDWRYRPVHPPGLKEFRLM